MMNQENALVNSLDNDSVVLGARNCTLSMPLIEIYGELGLDFVWLDFEHSGKSPWDSTLFENYTRAAEASDIELLVRLPYGNPPLIRKVIDAGVRNILIPRVDTEKEVRRAVKASRFAHDGAPGERGHGSGRSRGYGNSEEYVQNEDANVRLGVIIEKKSAVDNLSEILSVPELGYVFIGPGDLSIQTGFGGNKTDPKLQELIERIETATKEAGIPLGGTASDLQTAQRKIDRGYQILRIGDEFQAVRETIGNRMSKL